MELFFSDRNSDSIVVVLFGTLITIPKLSDFSGLIKELVNYNVSRIFEKAVGIRIF